MLLEDPQSGGPELSIEERRSPLTSNWPYSSPIIGPRGLFGIIYADRFDAIERFDADDLDLLNAVSVHMGIAINTVINYERLQKQAQACSSFERFRRARSSIRSCARPTRSDSEASGRK